MIIFFHEDAPAYIADFCYLINPEGGDYDIRIGDSLLIGSEQYPVTAIGDVAVQNFEALGHLTVKFDGATEPAQPGTMHVSGKIPDINAGTRIEFI